MEMTKRGVPGVWTYGFYDGWVPNYMFYTAHAHNSTGRFYEVQSYGPDTTTVRPGATVTSREWFPAQPAACQHRVGPEEQHEHPGIGDPLRPASRGGGQGSVPGKLLAQEQALV